ncbi:hypothetical protein ACFX13_007645 [Malus domestica]
MAAYSNFPEDSMGLNFDLVGPSSPQLPSSVFKSRANDFEERNRCGSHIRSQLNQVIVQPPMPSPINNEGAFEAFTELHHDVLGSSHLRLGAHRVNVFADPYKGKKVNVFKPGSLTPYVRLHQRGRRIPVIHAASSAIFDHARFVRVVRAYLIDYAFTVIPDIHRDWSWIVHPKQDFHNRMKDITRRCLEMVLLERVGDYLDVKKLNRAVKVPRDDQTESRMAKRKTATSSRIECR